MRKYPFGRFVARTIPALLLLLFVTGFTTLNEPVNTAAVWNIPAGFARHQPDYTVIDEYAKAAPESYARNMRTLTEYLTAPARSDLAKARSVYAWIMANITYDEAAYGARKYSSEILYANRVLQNRRAVCTGFALLYKHMLRLAGVDVMNVKGYSRSEDGQAGVAVGPIDHEWNAVKLDGDWYLLDLAWASTTARNGRANDHWFLTEPRQFVAQHLPADSRWQLLAPTISKSEFDRYPKLYDAYFRLGFADDFPKTGYIQTIGDVVLDFENPNQSVEFLCSYSRKGSSTAKHVPFFLKKNGDTYSLLVKLPQSGTSTLYVFAKPKSGRAERVKSYEGIASFTVVKR